MSIIHLTAAQRQQLEAALGRAQQARLYRRLLALLELDRGHSLSAVAAAVGVTRQSVYNWVQLYEAGREPLDLADAYGAGRPTVWNQALRQLLRAALRQTPDRLGYAAVRWTVPLLRDHLAQHGGRWLSEDTVRRELQRQGYVWKRFRYVLPADPEAEKKTPRPRLAEKPARAQRAAGRGRDRPAALPAAALGVGGARAASSGAPERGQRQAGDLRHAEPGNRPPLVPGATAVTGR